jgi:hypothetical protein
MATKKTSKSNVIADNTQTLQTFDLLDLEQYTKEKSFSNNASMDFHLFFVGRDDVHDILKHVLSRVSVSLYMNMFGYDDDELNDIVMNLIMDKSVTVMITLDQSQSNGKHEKALLDADRKKSLSRFNSYVTVGESATRQISHTKGFVADGKVGGEGSTNWSNSGEGTFVTNGAPGGSGYKAQNNTQTIFTDPDSVSRFQTELITEHLSAHNPTTHAATKKAPAKVAPKARTR